MAKRDDYKVGYGRPPKSGQFKKGHSGNPKGRPKGQKSFEAIIDEVFRKKITLRENRKVKRIPRVEALFRRVLNDGLKGDAKATDQAIKLLQSMNSLRGHSTTSNDGTAPDSEADLAALETLLKLHGFESDADDDDDVE